MFRNLFFHTRYQPHNKHALKWIRSGAQTGVDRGALDAALSLSMPIRGWVPKDFLAREPIPQTYFPMLKEMTADIFPQLSGLTDELEIYRYRTEQNAKEGDGTLIIMQNASEYCGGTQYTGNMAIKHAKPLFILDLSQNLKIEEVIKWIQTHKIYDLNVGGPNEQKSPGIYGATFDVISTLIRHPELNQELTVHDCHKMIHNKRII